MTAPDTTDLVDMTGLTGLTGISGVQLAGRTVDITFDGSVVNTIRPHDPGTSENMLDLRGYSVLPATADPHAHLDKSRSWDLVNPPVGDLPGAVDAWSAAAARFSEEDILTRARGTALSMLAAGTTAVRSHVDVYPDAITGTDPFRGIRAVDQLRRELEGMTTLQIVALIPASTPVSRVAQLVAGALDTGADLVGGAPHLAHDPLSQTDALIDAAEAHAVGCDLHIDEFTEVGAAGSPNARTSRTQTIHRYAERVTGWPEGRDRAAGHCCRLSGMTAAELDTTAVELRAAHIPVIALPATNLYLQASDSRGIAPVTALREKGVRVAAGGDNVADPFNPTGRADALETASLLITAAHQTPDQALGLVTTDARAAMNLPPAGPTPGARADLLCVRSPGPRSAGTAGPAPSTASLIAAAPSDRVVISSGRLVARTTSVTTYPHLRPST
ncbi:amidohydrolase family protein [Corynebacterium glyciniphilum]|uniref:amidohydrolase family protein n=1 Tax=Corynebacterium glyciniphilum TaxID=1404244 RepID=UPI003FD53068